MKEYQSHISQAQGHYAILASRWNVALVEQLKTGVKAAFSEHGIFENNIKEFFAPGAYEFPLVAQELAKSGKYDAIITLGAVIRGDTPHFDFVAGECASGLTRASMDAGVPIVFGVLTVNNFEQAEERANINKSNKGGEFAETAMEMVALLREIKGK